MEPRFRLLKMAFGLLLAMTAYIVIVIFSIQLGGTGAYTTLPTWVFEFAPWGIAIIVVILLGKSSLPQSGYSNLLSTIAISIIVIAIISTVEGKMRLDGSISPDWIRWTNQNAWLKPLDNQILFWENFSPIGLIVSIITTSNTFTIIIYRVALSQAAPQIYTPLSSLAILKEIVVALGLVAVLSFALQIYVAGVSETLTTLNLSANLSNLVIALRSHWNRLRTSQIWLRINTWFRWFSRLRFPHFAGQVLTVFLVALVISDFAGVALTWHIQEVTWTPIQTHGFPVGYPHSIQSILVEKGKERVWVGTYEGGVFRSNDHGKSWEPAR